ncbi:unnamed protein product [Timema podura]|uniref:Uncharacterized protein n=1 Tax=Timema podura TaxID=61482 RepID=A0ABN7NUZ0_TIMPD|nr:unnamed protein product [Timema podura]
MAAWSKVLLSLFRSNDGVDRQESGLLKNVNSANPSLSVSGTYTYVVDGKTISVSYVADENGFQPKESEEDRSEKGGERWERRGKVGKEGMERGLCRPSVELETSMIALVEEAAT